ncbi:hypothetical protein [Pseudomonas piscis]|uniref:hypothetical protein n=1 Tax=Pseudomonas piscis TaxID=2614538 RepID=UPI0003B57128|nr:hypothetical protein P308_06260 [Pseudomonas piscis]
MDYPKSVPSAGLVNGRFVDENPLTGSPGSLIPADWGNGITQEILNVIKAAGLVPDERKTDQLTQAIGELLDFKRLKNTPTTLGGYGISDASGRLLAVKQFETVGITLYRPDPRAKRIRVRLVGAGGSGGGCQPVPAGSFTVGGGGGSGAYAEGLFDVTSQMLAGVPVTLGAGGEARAVVGASGGSASFGSYMSASGGTGGQVITFVSTAPGFVQGGRRRRGGDGRQPFQCPWHTGRLCHEQSELGHVGGLRCSQSVRRRDCRYRTEQHRPPRGTWFGRRRQLFLPSHCRLLERCRWQWLL